MITYFFGNEGQLVGLTTGDDCEITARMTASLGARHTATSEAKYTQDDIYHDGVEVRQKPARPSLLHVFDIPSGAWALDMEVAWRAVRAQRDAQLRLTVDTVSPMRWLAMTPGQQAAWSAYRQALLNVTQQSDPVSITWPELPA